MWISVSSVGHTLSAFPSGKRVKFHANTCTPGTELVIIFSSKRHILAGFAKSFFFPF